MDSRSHKDGSSSHKDIYTIAGKDGYKVTYGWIAGHTSMAATSHKDGSKLHKDGSMAQKDI